MIQDNNYSRPQCECTLGCCDPAACHDRGSGVAIAEFLTSAATSNEGRL